MKSQNIADLSLALAIVAAPLLYAGIFSMLGDPAPRVTPDDMTAIRTRSLAMLGGGLIAMFASVWLSGYSFRSAPRRSMVAFVLCAATIGGFWFV